MIELPEAVNLSRQLDDVLSGRTIEEAVAGSSPHGFAWYSGDPSSYSLRLAGKRVLGCENKCGHVWINLEGDASLILAEGPAIRYWGATSPEPKKHQLLLTLDDGCRLSATTRMYAFYALNDGFEPLNPYPAKAAEGPDVLLSDFTLDRFLGLAEEADNGKLSCKALLATQQRFPGLGNGVLQDILFNAGANPKLPIRVLGGEGLERLFQSMKETLAEMTALGGRDTESDIFGDPGGYMTKLSKKGVERGCPQCGGSIVKEAYMGGSVYYCPVCQPL